MLAWLCIRWMPFLWYIASGPSLCHKSIEFGCYLQDCILSGQNCVKRHWPRKVKNCIQLWQPMLECSPEMCASPFWSPEILCCAVAFFYECCSLSSTFDSDTYSWPSNLPWSPFSSCWTKITVKEFHIVLFRDNEGSFGNLFKNKNQNSFQPIGPRCCRPGFSL